MDDVKRLIREIHRRSVWQVLGIYLVVSAGALEIVDYLVDSAGLPDWFPSFALALLVVGLPIVLGTAIVQEGGPGAWGDAPPEGAGTGVVPDPETEVTPTRGEDEAAPDGFASLGRLLTWRNAVLGGVAAFALWGMVAAGILLTRYGEEVGVGGEDEIAWSVAVLPFESLSADPENDYFAQGVHDDILTQLSKIGSLRVISRTSVLQYAGPTKPPVREIARELGVGVVLEGSVQRAGSQVKVTTQLIDGRTDAHLWAENYTRQVDDVFALQAEIAREVADALRARLLPEEAERLARRPTKSLEAWQLYQQGEVTSERYLNPDDARQGVELYRRATEVDPEFAQAWAGLARSTVWLFWNFTRDTLDRRAAGRALERAVALDPDAPSVHAARGYYAYYGHRSFQEALEHFESAIEVRPSYADAYARVGYIRRRLGQWNLGMEALRRAQELDPRSAELASGYGETLSFVGRYEDAERFFELALSIQPGVVSFHRRKLLMILRGRADTVAARRMVEHLPDQAAPWIHDAMAAEVAVWRRDYRGALEHAFEDNAALHPEAFALVKVGTPAEIAEAVERLMPEAVDLDGAPDAVPAFGGDDRTAALRSGAWLNLLRGRHAAALAWARAAEESLTLQEDAYSGVYGVYHGAMILALAGEDEAALDRIELLLEHPTIFSPAGIRLEPAFEDLRHHPRFVELAGRD